MPSSRAAECSSSRTRLSTSPVDGLGWARRAACLKSTFELVISDLSSLATYPLARPFANTVNDLELPALARSAAAFWYPTYHWRRTHHLRCYILYTIIPHNSITHNNTLGVMPVIYALSRASHMLHRCGIQLIAEVVLGGAPARTRSVRVGSVRALTASRCSKKRKPGI